MNASIQRGSITIIFTIP